MRTDILHWNSCLNELDGHLRPAKKSNTIYTKRAWVDDGWAPSVEDDIMDYALCQSNLSRSASVGDLCIIIVSEQDWYGPH